MTGLTGFNDLDQTPQFVRQESLSSRLAKSKDAKKEAKAVGISVYLDFWLTFMSI